MPWLDAFREAWSSGDIHAAESVCRAAAAEDDQDWNAHYLLGVTLRFQGNFRGALASYERALENCPCPAPILTARGIAHQQLGNFSEAISAFERSLQLEPDSEECLNSLALTQKKVGELDKALHNYDAGAKALARRIVKAMQNNRTSPILKHRETVGNLWVEYALYAALYLASSAEGIDVFALPTAELALEEERTEKHAGLYWIDAPNDERDTVRLFLPNFFDTFRGLLKRDAVYSNLIGNRGTVLELLGRHDEARQHFDEATEFLPLG